MARARIAKILLFTSILLSSASSAEQAQLIVDFDNSAKTSRSPYAVLFQEQHSLDPVVQLINETVPLREQVRVIIGAEDGPLFDPNINEIWVPDAFLDEIDTRFSDADLVNNATDKETVVLDVLVHTLLHEMGHAVIAQFNIPTLGKEEDAADNLANVLLLEYLDEGDSIVINAADMFALEDQDKDTFEDADFWDEHSLDLQRYFTSLCHVYGSHPDDHDDLIRTGELSADRAERCIDEYEIIAADWLHVLSELER